MEAKLDNSTLSISYGAFTHNGSRYVRNKVLVTKPNAHQIEKFTISQLESRVSLFGASTRPKRSRYLTTAALRSEDSSLFCSLRGPRASSASSLGCHKLAWPRLLLFATSFSALERAGIGLLKPRPLRQCVCWCSNFFCEPTFYPALTIPLLLLSLCYITVCLH